MPVDIGKKSFTMMMTAEEHNALRAEAEAQGMTMTQIIRIWIRAALLKRPVTIPSE
jgi:hypothetical protein